MADEIVCSQAALDAWAAENAPTAGRDQVTAFAAGNVGDSGDAPPASEVSQADDDEKTCKQSIASRLVAFTEERAVLFHDPSKDVYARDRATGEVRRIEGRQFRDWLVSGFFETAGKSASDQAVREAIGVLSGIGRYRGECCEVHIRVAGQDGRYFLDLGQPGNNRVVCITPGAWEIVSQSGVSFVRPESLRPLPEPQRGGCLDALWKIGNVPKNERLLVIAWLCECFRPDTPFHCLNCSGNKARPNPRRRTHFAC